MKRPFEHQCLDCGAVWFDDNPRWAWCKCCSHEVVVSKMRSDGSRIGPADFPEPTPEGPPPSNRKTWEAWNDGRF